MGACVHSAPYLPCPNTGTLIPLTKALTRCSFGQATCHERSDGSHWILNLLCFDPALIGFNKKIYFPVHMPVVSLNLTEQAYRAYIQVPRGRRSQVFSAIIEKRDLNQKMQGEGVLADMGFTTVGEAIREQTVIIERQMKVIAQLQKREAD